MSETEDADRPSPGPRELPEPAGQDGSAAGRRPAGGGGGAGPASPDEPVRTDHAGDADTARAAAPETEAAEDGQRRDTDPLIGYEPL